MSHPRPENTVPPPGAHGGDGPRIAAALGLDPADVLDLAASLNPVAPDPSPVVARHLDAVHRYPDPAGRPRSPRRSGSASARLTNVGAEASRSSAHCSAAGSTNRLPLPQGPPPTSGPARGAPTSRGGGRPHSPSGRSAPPPTSPACGTKTPPPRHRGVDRGAGESDAVVVGSLTAPGCPGLRIGYVLAPGPARRTPRPRRARRAAVVGVRTGVRGAPDLLTTVDLPAGCQWRRSRPVGTLVAHGLVVHAGAPWVLVDDPGGLRDAWPPGVVVRTARHAPRPLRIAVPDDDGRHRLDIALSRSGSDPERARG